MSIKDPSIPGSFSTQTSLVFDSGAVQKFLDSFAAFKPFEKDIIDLQKEYQNKKDILEKLTNINQEYNHLLKQEDEALITIHQDNYKEYQEYIFSIIHKTLMNLSPDDTYRKRDLLKSIERKHQL